MPTGNPDDDWSFLQTYLDTGKVAAAGPNSGGGQKSPIPNEAPRVRHDLVADAGASHDFIRYMWHHYRRTEPGFALATLGNMLMIFFGKDWVIESYRFYYKEAWGELQALIQKTENQQLLLQTLKQ